MMRDNGVGATSSNIQLFLDSYLELEVVWSRTLTLDKQTYMPIFVIEARFAYNRIFITRIIACLLVQPCC